MKGREQKILNNNYPQDDRAALENKAEVQTFILIDETESTRCRTDTGLLEYVLSPLNLNNAYRQVVINQGSSGIDKMEVKGWCFKKYAATIIIKKR